MVFKLQEDNMPYSSAPKKRQPTPQLGTPKHGKNAHLSYIKPLAKIYRPPKEQLTYQPPNDEAAYTASDQDMQGKKGKEGVYIFVGAQGAAGEAYPSSIPWPEWCWP